MCPWHGACFRVQTGDIEDAPSVDHLQSFKVVVRSGKVFLSVNEAQVKAGKRAPVCVKKVGKQEVTVVVGGGAAGLITAEALREVHVIHVGRIFRKDCYYLEGKLFAHR
jgi:putative NADH-flavin reductase